MYCLKDKLLWWNEEKALVKSDKHLQIWHQHMCHTMIKWEMFNFIADGDGHVTTVPDVDKINGDGESNMI